MSIREKEECKLYSFWLPKSMFRDLKVVSAYKDVSTAETIRRLLVPYLKTEIKNCK